MKRSTEPKVTFLVSHERSGSHLLGEMVRSFAGIRVFDEVCNPRAIVPSRDSESFHGYKHYWLTEHPEGLALTNDHNIRLLRDYVDHLRSLARAKHALVDVKYGHVHNFEGAWWPIVRTPALFELTRTGEVAMIHLYRKDVVAATISDHVAEKRRVWRLEAGDDDSSLGQSYTLDPEAVARDASWLLRQVELIREFGATVAIPLEITYEEMVASLESTDGTLMSRVATVTGGEPPEAFTPRQRKLIESISSTVLNADEVLEACRAAGHSVTAS